MNKDEAAFHAKLMKWLKYNLKSFPKSFKIETKVVRREDKAFYYPELTAKEERILLRAKHGSCIQTNSDESRRGTPCDGDVISGGAFIFLQWQRRGNKEFFVIDIDAFLEERDSSDRKSLTEERAREISYLISKHV